MATHSIMAVTNMTANATTANPAVIAAWGAANVSLKGFRLDTTFVEAAQMMDNTKRVALMGGDTVALVNGVLAGDLTLHAVRVGGVSDGDVIEVATRLQAIGDSTGITLSFSVPFKGGSLAHTFTSCTIKSVPPIRIHGNDVPEIPVVFSYGAYAAVYTPAA